MKTKEIYSLHDNALPTIPAPHDCVIKNVRLERDCLVFVFEDDISYHDSIKNTRPDVKSLIMTFHLAFDADDVKMFLKCKPTRFSRNLSVYKEVDLTKNKQILAQLCRDRLEYLCHNIGFGSIIIQLASQIGGGIVVFEAQVRSVEFDWIY